MKILGVIPARYASTRFPGKPLVDIQGMSMIQRVYEQAKKSSSLAAVVVATDDERIFDHVKEFGGEVVMTHTEHASGTDRIAEVISMNNYSSYDAVVNIQGDEPFIQPSQIDLVCSLFEDPVTEIGTLIKKIEDAEELHNPNLPKVVCNVNDDAIYFSRSPIPFLRGVEPEQWLNQHSFYKHIGIYAYRTWVLKEIAALSKGSLELAESLEQLRWLENGYKISTAKTDLETIAIDTPEDLLKT